MSRPLFLVAVVVALAEPARADACRTGPGRSVEPRTCPSGDRLRPYEPSRVRAGRESGLVDLGNGTEVRIGGRVRMDYDARR